MWAFVDRFRDVLFAEPALKIDEEGVEKGGRATASHKSRGERRGGGGGVGGKSSFPEHDARAPAEAAPPTPAALAAALAVGDVACGAALVGALLVPLLASHAAAAPAHILAEALSLAQPPANDAHQAVSGGVWEETLRRYLFGAAAAMDLPPESTTTRAAADIAEVVCKWVCGGGPTMLPNPPDTGTVMTPSMAAAWAATLEGVPKPPPSLAARADAEALAACEIELFASGAEGSRGASERRQKAVAAAAAAADSPAANAVRQAVRMLAHCDKHRHPALGQMAAREHANVAAGVPFFASVAAGAGSTAAARVKHPRAVDYEAIDARAAAGVYAVANLLDGSLGSGGAGGSSGGSAGAGGGDAMARADAAECGELLLAAGAPDRSTPHAVSTRMDRALRRGRPEGRGKDGNVSVDGAELPLLGGEEAALPKVAWDDGCAVCGGDIAAGPVLLCDACDGEFHCACLDPPLAAVPDDDWYCPRCERAQERLDCESRALVALNGTQLESAVAGRAAGGTGGDGGGSTRARAEVARRLRALAHTLLRRGGWAGLTPAERLGALRELTWQLLDCSLVRAVLESGEKKTGEAREALRRHIKDWTSYRKHGISIADASTISTAARAAAEDVAEGAEADAKVAADMAEGVEADAKVAASAGAEVEVEVGAGAVAEAGATGTEAEAEVKADAVKEALALIDKKEDGGSAGGPAIKSHPVRMAGIAAAAAAVAVISEAEGRTRWQARWHHLEYTLRAVELRLDALGVIFLTLNPKP